MRTACIVVLTSVLAAVPAAAQEYTAVRIPLADPGRPHGTAINASGHVVGVTGRVAPFYFANGRTVLLGGPLGLYELTAINANDEIVGDYLSNLALHGVVYRNLQVGALTSPDQEVTGITDLGELLGNCWVGGEVGCVVVNGATTRLPTLSGQGSRAAAINLRGQVTGSSVVSSILFPTPVPHAFFYASGQIRDLGSLRGPQGVSRGNAINAAGDVVGLSDAASGAQHAFRWTSATGVMTDLGTLGGTGSEALGINAAGQVVGRADALDAARAFLWRGGAMVDLNTLVSLGDTLTEATAINDAGQIVANSATQAYLLTPRQLQRFAYAFADRPSTIDYTPNAAYAYNASGGAIHVHRQGVGAYDVTFDAFSGWGADLSSAFAVSTTGSSMVTCSVATYSSSTTSVSAGVSCLDARTGLPAEAAFTILVVGNASLPSPSAFVITGGAAPVPPPSPLVSWTTGRVAPSATHNAALGDYNVQLGTGNTAQSVKLVTASGGGGRCNYAAAVSGGIEVRCYDATGAAADHSFSVLQVAGARTDRRLGFALADKPTTASYTTDPGLSFNSSGGAILVERGLVGRYSIKFVGLQKQPGHSEIVQVTAVGYPLRSCQIFAWATSGDGTSLQAAVECRDANGDFIDSRYEILVME